MELNFPLKKIKFCGTDSNGTSIPLGGIGTGCVYLNSDGSLNNFDIADFSNSLLENLFVDFSVFAESNGKKCKLNLSSTAQASTEGFSDCDFLMSFPFGELCYEGGNFPGKINFTAFNPLIPHNSIDSTIPAAFLEYEIINDTNAPATYIISGRMNNPFKNPVNTFYSTKVNNICGIQLTADKSSDNKSKSEFSFGICGEGIEYLEYIGDSSYCLLSSNVTIEPGENKIVRFIVSWYSTYGKSDIRCSLNSNQNDLWKNYYTKYFTGADEIVYYCLSQWRRLYSETDLYRNLLFSSTIPIEALSAVSKNIENIKHPGFIRYEDGCLYPVKCKALDQMENSAVMTYLFPALERQRLQNRLYNECDKSDGTVNQLLETIISVYKQFTVSGNVKWLTDIWHDFTRTCENLCNFDISKDENCSESLVKSHFIEMYLSSLNAAIWLAKVIKDKKHVNMLSHTFDNLRQLSGNVQPDSSSAVKYGYELLSDFCGSEIDLYQKSYKFIPDMSYAENGVFRCFICFEDFLGFIECGIDYFQINCLKGSVYVRNIEVPAEPLLVKVGGMNIGFTANGNTAVLDNDCEVNTKRDLFIVLRT